MDNNTHYFRVGLFVIVLTITFIVFALWLSVGLSNKSYKYYLVFMQESVSGLNTKAPVKYNGVEIGFIKSIQLYKQNPQLVELTLSLDANVPIYADTQAILETQGLTGIAYLELKGGAPDSTLLQKEPGQPYPVIQTAPSLLYRLDNVIDDLAKNLNSISQSVRAVLNTENITSLTDILNNFRVFSKQLEKNSLQLDNIINNTSKASDALPQLMQTIEKSATSVQNIAAELKGASVQAKVTFEEAATTMGTINQQLLPQVQSTMNNLQSTSVNVKSLSEQLDENPSILLRGKQAAAPGPGE